MPSIRVLVVDDSVVIRKVLCESLVSDPEIEIAGSAPDGSIALSKIRQLKPDVVTLDVEMPVMSGIETLTEIRKLYPTLPVIMFSTLTERGAATTLDALALGASDYLTKPQGAGSVEETRRRIQQELIPKLKGLCHRTWFNTTTPVAPSVGNVEKPPTPRVNIQSGRIDLVAIGTSTGGPNALAVVLPAIPKDFPVPIVIVQHMPPLFTRLLAERLQKQSAIKIREGQAGAVLKAGEAWIAPGDFHMVVNREEREVKLALNQEPPENSCRPAVDVLFRSVARTYGANALGVVLTGMGSDGVLGTKTMKAAGAQIVVQDEATSVVWGMPGQVTAAGVADGVYPLEEIAAELQRRTSKSLWFQDKKGSGRQESTEADKVRQGDSTNSFFAGRERQ